jgi:peptidoglycan/LPS O-acetylase OafA/YrhL
MQSTEPRIHFFNLDILRFIAVFMVVFFHGYLAYTGWFGGSPTPPSANTPPLISSLIHSLIYNGDLGVDLFFLISGFLITYLLLKEREISGKISIRNFYIRRTLRIWPLYFLIIALTPAIVSLSDAKAPEYWWTICFATNFQTISGTPDLFPFAHFWSVCVEEHFYLIWPLLILFIPPKKLPLSFATLILLSISFRYYLF